MSAVFGTAGNCEDFYASGRKSSLEAPEWIKINGLCAYEYQCGKGVKISPDAAKKLGSSAKEHGIVLSLHAPYYISLSSTDPEKRTNSIGYILASLEAAKNMGATRVVVHSGSCGSITRRNALNLAKDTLHRALTAADEAGYGDISLCPETMGKINQLGSIDEVLELCSIDSRLIPTVDFGHVNAMTLGGLCSLEAVEALLDKIKNALGGFRYEHFHAHYSRIEYTNSGEKKHRRFDETEFEPDFDPIAEAIAKRDLSPTIICESRGSQTKDASTIQEIYRRFKGTGNAAIKD